MLPYEIKLQTEPIEQSELVFPPNVFPSNWTRVYNVLYGQEIVFYHGGEREQSKVILKGRLCTIDCLENESVNVTTTKRNILAGLLDDLARLSALKIVLIDTVESMAEAGELDKAVIYYQNKGRMVDLRIFRDYDNCLDGDFDKKLQRDVELVKRLFAVDECILEEVVTSSASALDWETKRMYQTQLASLFQRTVISKGAQFAAVYRIDKTTGGHYPHATVTATAPGVIKAGHRPCDTFSTCKSLVGLVVARDHLLNKFAVDEDVSSWLEAMEMEPEDFPDLSIIELINHISGIPDDGMTGKGGVKKALEYITSKDKRSHHFIKKWTLGGIDEARRGKFKYNNIGSQFATCLYELVKRTEQLALVSGDVDELDEDFYFVRDECMTVFFPEELRGVYWPLCEGHSIQQHSWGFSGVRMSGEQMACLGKSLWTKHLPLLEFISGKSCANKFIIVDANDHGVSLDAGTKLQYKYSFGWWILPLEGRRIITSIGYTGEFITIDVDSGTVAVRQHPLGMLTPEGSSGYRNQHPEYPWYAIAFMDSLEDIEHAKSVKECEEIVEAFANFAENKMKSIKKKTN